MICAWDLGLDLQTSVLPEYDEKPPAPQASRLRQQVQAHTHWINDIALAHSNQALVSASSDITVKLWRPQASDGLPPQTIGLHSDYVKVLAVPSTTSDWVASGGLDRKINVWDLRGGGQRLSIDVSDDEAGNMSLAAKGSVYALAATPKTIASGGPEGTLRVWDNRTGKRITKLVGHTDIVRDVLVSQDGATIITASSDKTVKVWSTIAGRCMYTLTMHEASIWSLYSSHPDLSVFYSSDRYGLVAKTDTRNTIELDEGFSMAVAQEHAGVHKVVAAGEYLWTATSQPSISRWRDINTDNAEVEVSEDLNKDRKSVSSTTIRIPSPPKSPTAARQTASPRRRIPLKHVLRMSSTAYYPGRALPNGEKRGSVGERRGSREDISDLILTYPVRGRPDFVIEGQSGLIKHVMLNDRKRVLTLDTAGEVMLWDLLKCVPIKSFGKRHIDDVREEMTTNVTVANWCSVDTRTGSVAVVLEENTCFDAEMYADELDLDEGVEFREDQRINLGKWVLRYLFSGLIDEQLRRDEAYRKQLLVAQEERRRLLNENTSSPLPTSHPQTNGLHIDTNTGPATFQRSRPNNITMPQTPGLGISLMTPISATTASPTSPLPRPNALALSPTVEHPSIDRTLTPQARQPPGRQSGDYFSSTPLESAIDEKDPSTPAAVEGTPKPETPSGKEAGLFGKKFSMRGMSFSSMKKIGRANTNERDKQPTVEEKDEGTESDSRSTKTSSSRVIDDNLLGTAQKIRYSYEDALQHQGQPHQGHENGLPVPSDPEGDLPSAMTPSLPAETPILRPPLTTKILIQEDRPEAGGVADLFEGNVGALGHPSICDLVEKVAPMWLGDVLLRNQIPPKDVQKISFVLEPQQGSGLMSIAADGNNRLNANKLLRAKKILGYVADRIEPGLTDEEREEQQRWRAEEYLELRCLDKVSYPLPSLSEVCLLRFIC